jgi:glutaredoxin-related protein
VAVEPEPEPEPPRELNPEATGKGRLERRTTMERLHERNMTRAGDEAEDRMLQSLVQTMSGVTTGNQLSVGVSAPRTDNGHSRNVQRDYWKQQLHQEPVSVQGAVAIGRDAYRLLNTDTEIKDLTGTIRGKKNSVRQRLGTFEGRAQVVNSEGPTIVERLYAAEKDKKIVIYTTSLAAIRATRDECGAMLKLFDLLHLKVIVKDVHLEPKFAKELEARLGSNGFNPPQLFINATHIGGLEQVVAMNDGGDLKMATHGFEKKSNEMCEPCGGYGYVLCTWCQGSHKSRSTMYPEDPRKPTIKVLKCTVCNTNGLISCPLCSG